MKNIVAFLEENQDNDFYASLLAQYDRKGFLSERQLQCVERAIEERERRATRAAPVKASIDLGQIIEIKTWLAKRLQNELHMDFFLRNLEVTQVVAETAKAYQMKVKFVSRIACNCHVCGRALDNEISKAVGIGPVCAEKIGLSRPSLSDAQRTIDELESLCRKIGEIGPLWVPKSQIKLKVQEAA